MFSDWILYINVSFFRPISEGDVVREQARRGVYRADRRRRVKRIAIIFHEIDTIGRVFSQCGSSAIWPSKILYRIKRAIGK